MKNLTLSLLLILSAICCFPQDDQKKYIPHDYSKLPPSPEVSSLMKYIDFPVSHFTGQPEINIPIYTIREGNLTIPISVSYHGGGIKVNEHAGIIGMGWTLIAGGSLSRTVNGLPDETYSGRFSSLHGIFNLSSDEKMLRSVVMNRVAEYSPEEFGNNPQIEESSKYCYSYDDGKVDTANDIFQFNFMGLSGTFIQSPENGKITMSTGSPVTFGKNFISMLSNYPDCYMFTDKDGTNYELAEVEKTRHEYSYQNGGQAIMDSILYTSAWHLTKVANTYGDAATFQYSEARFKNLSSGAYNYFAYSGNETLLPCEGISTGNSIIYYPKVLKSITGKTTTVRFYYDDKQETLLKITVHRNDANSTQIKQINFIHQSRKFGYTYKNMLTEIEEVSGGKTQTLYKFGYEGGNTLEDGYDYSQDHWGYYNGKVNPSLLWSKSALLPTRTKLALDREPNLGSNKIGILTSITYPTGGTSSFDWELNDYSFYANHLISSSSSSDTIVNNYSISGISKCENLQTGTIDVTEYSSGSHTTVYINMSKYIKSIMDGGTFNWDAEYNHSHYDKRETDNYDLTSYPNHPHIQIIKKNANGTETIKERFFIDRETCDRAGTLGPGVYATSLGIGRYYIKLVNPRNFIGVPDNQINGYFGNGADANCYESGYIPIKIVNVKEGPKSNIKNWGGLRIKSISSRTGFDIICKNYDYTYEYEFDGKTHSSGVITQIPDYDYIKCKGAYIGKGPNQFQPGMVIMYCSTSNGLYSTPNGNSHVQYMTVNESYSGNNFGKMKVRYNYTSQFDFPDEKNMLLETYAPAGSRIYTSMSHKRGILSEKIFFNQNDFPYKNINYEYDVLEGSSPLFTNQLTQISDCNKMGHETYKSDYTVAKFKLIPYNKRLKSESTFEYEEGDYRYELRDSLKYTYFTNVYSDKPEDSFVRSKSYYNSLNQSVTVYYTYFKPADPGPYIDLKETEVMVVNGKIVSATRTSYDMNSKHPRYTYSCKMGIPVLPSYNLGVSHQTSNALSEAISTPEYSYEYDGLGNLIEIRYKGVVLASYLWGYKGTYPILEAKNVPISTLEGKLRELNINSTEALSEIADDNTIKNILNQMRTKLPDKDITTMTYHWLIGVSAATDSRGITTHFTFDDFGRLSDVKDYNGYFIRKYDYHYAGQNN